MQIRLSSDRLIFMIGIHILVRQHVYFETFPSSPIDILAGEINSMWPCDAILWCTVYPKKYAHGFRFAVLCCGYTLTDCPISIRLTSLALWQSNDCPSASKATLMNIDKYFMWVHYERLHNHNKAKHNKTVCIFLGIYCRSWSTITALNANSFVQVLAGRPPGSNPFTEPVTIYCQLKL